MSQDIELYQDGERPNFFLHGLTKEEFETLRLIIQREIAWERWEYQREVQREASRYEAAKERAETERRQFEWLDWLFCTILKLPALIVIWPLQALFAALKVVLWLTCYAAGLWLIITAWNDPTVIASFLGWLFEVVKLAVLNS
jgi:hypothetical protein